jgi:hypothetical protein
MNYEPQTAQQEQDELLAQKFPLTKPQREEFETQAEFEEALAFWNSKQET